MGMDFAAELSALIVKATEAGVELDEIIVEMESYLDGLRDEAA